MALTLLCHKCGRPITLTDEQIKEMAELNKPVDIVHESCENEVQELRLFRVKIEVWEVGERGEDILACDFDCSICREGEDIEDGGNALLASVGGHYKATDFTTALPGIQAELNKGWDQVVGMASVIDG